MRYGHIQEVIIQPFEPKPGTRMATVPRPCFQDILKTVRIAKRLLPDVGIQVPPNLLDSGRLRALVSAVLKAGANDFGGISPLTPDYINPTNPWPPLQELKRIVECEGFSLQERLPVYPKFLKNKFMSKEVKRVVRKLADADGFRAN